MSRRTSPAKEFLRKIRTEQKEYQALVDSLETIRLSLMPSGIRYDKDKIQVSPVDIMPEKIAQLCETEDAIVEHMRNLDERRARAMTVTRQIDDPACRMVIELYYLTVGNDGLLRKWEEVADAMGYTQDHVLRDIHPKALREFERIVKENERSQ